MVISLAFAHCRAIRGAHRRAKTDNYRKSSTRQNRQGDREEAIGTEPTSMTETRPAHAR
jgi:hypothetical protein